MKDFIEYIAKQLVELHGGTIEARSLGRGTGTTFEVYLPSNMPAPSAQVWAGLHVVHGWTDTTAPPFMFMAQLAVLFRMSRPSALS